MERRELIRALSENSTDDLFYVKDLLRVLVSTFQARTVYGLTDSFCFSYRFLLLPETETPSLLTIGPYHTAELSAQQLLELGEKSGIPTQKQRCFAEYYESIPVLDANCAL